MDKWYIVNNGEFINNEIRSIFKFNKLEEIDNISKNTNNENIIKQKLQKNHHDKVNDYWENFIKFESAWTL